MNKHNTTSQAERGPSRELRQGGRSTQKGFSLVYAIFVILALGTLSAALVTLTRSGMETELNETSISQARYIALAGFNYLKQFKEDYLELEDKTFSFGNAGQFTISDMRYLPTLSGRMEARVQGTVFPGTSREANYVIFQEFDVEDQGSITFRENFDDFTPITSDDSKTPILKNSDNTFSIGANQYNAFGAMYYTGDKELNWGANNCTDGVCDFKMGFRMFFVSTYTASAADGLVFTWFNSDNNTTSSVGGDSQHGEMMGYAADSRIYLRASSGGEVYRFLDGQATGIRPPKMGVEFDNYMNNYTDSICSTNKFTDPLTSRRSDHYDGTQWKRAHVAHVFWGDDSEPNGFDCCYWWKQVTTGRYPHQTTTDYPYTATLDGDTATWQGAYAFDDNRHGQGDNWGNTQYWKTTFNWANNSFAYRLEVERDTEANGDGNYEYTLKSWIRQCSQPLCAEYFDRTSSDSDKNKLYFSDTSRFLCDGSTDVMTGKCDPANTNAPIMTQTVELTPAEHADFEAFIFGFTEATGGSTQNATFSEFILQFVKENDYTTEDGDVVKRRMINRPIN